VFFGRQQKHEIGRESLPITSYLFVQPLDGDVIEFREVAIEDDSLTPEDQDPRFNRDCELCGAFGHRAKWSIAPS
jgi:hypothetical protein